MSDACYLVEFTSPPGEVIEITGSEGHHAAAVKRTRVGERLLVANGEGLGVRGEVLSVSKAGVTVRVDEVLVDDRKGPRYTIVQALAKGDRSQIAVESLTELGADRIVAWQAARSVVRWENKADKGIARWQATARESTKQSRRLTVPQVSYATTDDVLDLVASADLAIVAHEEATEGLESLSLPEGDILVIVGPEGGISDEELTRFVKAGARPILLSDGVLRTSSAGVVALAQLGLRWRQIRSDR